MMRHCLQKIFVLLCCCLIAGRAFAMVEVKSDKNTQRRELRVTSFLDYPPFGEVIVDAYSLPKMHTIYNQFIEDFAKKNYYDLSYIIDKPYKDLVMNVLRGEIDLILGIYYDTDIYQGIEYIYPSILNNPMSVAMMPNRITEVRTMDDLKKLKGGMDSREHLADYVTKAMKNYNVVYVDNSKDLYQKLFTGEIDYVFTSYYYGIVQTSRLGIRRQVAFSKQSLWDMPLFIGISKTSRLRKSLYSTFSKMLQNDKYRKDLEQHLIQALKQEEQQNMGVVPPSFAKK